MPSTIRSQTFPQARRGWDPEAVAAFLDLVAAGMERLQEAQAATERELEAALEAAYLAERRERRSRRDGERIKSGAEDDARELLVNARREALELIARTRQDADAMLAEARREEVQLLQRLEGLRAVASRTENLMKGIASGALGKLAHAHLMLEEAPQPSDGLQVIVEDAATSSSGTSVSETAALPAEVDRLLSRLREIG